MRTTSAQAPRSLRYLLVMVGAIVGSALTISTPAGLTAGRTTGTPAPSRVAVTLTDAAITMKGPLSRKGAQWYPRGAVIDFVLQNKGTKAMHVRVKRLTTIHFPAADRYATFTVAPGKAIRPGKSRHFTLNFFYRSTFLMQTISSGKVIASKTLLVF